MGRSVSTLNNVGIGYLGRYNLTTGTENVFSRAAAGRPLSTGTGSICIGCNCNIYSGNCTCSIALGSRANSSLPNVFDTVDNQLYIAPTITSFNISGLTPSTGSREGTI